MPLMRLERMTASVVGTESRARRTEREGKTLGIK